MARLETALRDSPSVYESERRRAIAGRMQELSDVLEHYPPAGPIERAGLEEELERRRAALEPLTLAESWEDVRYAWRALVRQIWEAIRS